MSEFDSSKMRGVNLPPGCKDLVEVLNRRRSVGAPLPPAKVEQFAIEGLAQVGRFVRMVLDSEAEFCAVAISGIDLLNGLAFYRAQSENLFAITTTSKDAQQVNTILSLFKQEQLAPLLGPKNSDYFPQILGSRLPDDAERATSIITRVIRTNEGVTDGSGLDFLFISRD